MDDSFYECPDHDKAPYESFCENCKKHLCGKCDLLAHKKHSVVNFEELLKTIDLEDLKLRFKKAKNFYSRYLGTFKKTVKFKSKHTRKQIKEAFKICMKENEDIIWIIQQIFNNFKYNKHNYFVVSNLTRIGEFDLTECKNSEVKTAGAYFDWYFIGCVKELDFSRFVKKKRLYTHEDGRVYSLVRLKNGKIASCSSDKTIKIFNLLTNECELTIKGHTEDVTSITQISDNILASGSFDKTVKIWIINGSTYECEHTYQGHQNKIQKVITLTKDRIASCSKDKTIIIWSSKKPYTKLGTLVGHMRSVNSILQIRGTEKLISGSSDHSFMIWSLSSYKLETIIPEGGCKNPNTMIEISGNRLVSAIGPIITIFNLTNYKFLCWKRNPSDMRIYSMMEIENDHLFFGCMGGEFGLYDIKNNKIKHSYDHERRVTAWFLEKNDQSWMYDHKDRMMDKRKQRVNKKVYKKTMEYKFSLNEYVERRKKDLFSFFDDFITYNLHPDSDSDNWRIEGDNDYFKIPLEDFSIDIPDEEKCKRPKRLPKRLIYELDFPLYRDYEEPIEERRRNDTRQNEGNERNFDNDVNYDDNNYSYDDYYYDGDGCEYGDDYGCGYDNSDYDDYDGGNVYRHRYRNDDDYEEEEENQEKSISDSDIYTQVRRDTTSMNFHSPSYNPNVEKNEVLDKYPKFQRNLKDEFGFPQDGLINHPTYTKAEKARTITCLLHLEKNNFLTGYYYKKINVWGY